MAERREVTRRSVLRSGGALSGVGLLAGTAAAADRPGRYVVGTASPAADRAATDRAGRVDRVLDFGARGRAVAGRFSPEALDALRARKDVRYVEPDGTVPPVGQTLPWGVDRVDAERAHASGETGAGADVAIIDSGIDSDHPDLQPVLGEGYAVVTCSGCREPWDDDHGHGTHCAGIAGAVDDDGGVVGVSAAATLHAVKVFDADSYATVSGLAEGIQYVADQGWDVGSISLGATADYSTLRDACRYAADRGVLLVAAAGNDGPCTDCVRYPAAYSTVVAVSATASDDGPASYSSTGSEVELAAPGSSIYSTVPGGYGTMSGTSMACPHVSGAAGLVMADGTASADARDRLRSTAEDLGLTAAEQGAGLLDAEAAVGADGTDDGDTDANVAVSTGDASGVTETAATLSGSLTDLGGADSAECAFEYREVGASDWTATASTALTATGTYSRDVSGLASGTDYEFRAVATASDGDADAGSAVAFATETAETGDVAPTVESYAVTEAGSPNPHCEITADWAVADGDGDLATVTIAVREPDGTLVESAQTDASGSTASGTDRFKLKHRDRETFDVTVTVTDSGGASASCTDSVTS